MRYIVVLVAFIACNRDDAPPPAPEPQLPPECQVYERKLDELAACPRIAPDLRNDLASRLAEARTLWLSHRDTPRMARMCANAITALAQVAADCKPL